MKIEKEINKIKKELEDHKERISKLENKLPSISRIQEGIEGIEKLAKEIGLTKEKIREIFDIEENILTVVKTVGENNKEKIKNVSLLVLLGYKYLFERNELFSKEIRRNVAENDIPLNNFATYLKEIIPTLIRRKGKHKSTKTTYRLTTLGEAKAKKLLKEMITSSREVEEILEEKKPNHE